MDDKKIKIKPSSIFSKLPLELKYYIIYDMGGMENKTSKILKDFIRDSLYNNQVHTDMPENFYRHLISVGELIPVPNSILIMGGDFLDIEDFIDHILQHHMF